MKIKSNLLEDFQDFQIPTVQLKLVKGGIEKSELAVEKLETVITS